MKFGEVRKQFEVLDSTEVNGHDLVYLDSAASTLKPKVVVDKLSHFYSFHSSNVHRGAHQLSDQATEMFENGREKVRTFINASSKDEIVFTRGTTESINLVANGLAESLLKEGDEIVLTEMEHHSNIVPWQMIAEKKGLKIKYIPVNNLGELDYEKAQKIIGSKTKLVAFNSISNALGTINNVEKIIGLAKEVKALTLVDAAQSVAFHSTDVTKMDCDFLVFSGHKLFGPYGIGVLYGKKDVLNKLPPYQGGGSMIDEVTLEKTTFLEAPHRFEAGTPHIAGVVGLGEAIDFVQSIGMSQIENHELELYEEAKSEFEKIEGLSIYSKGKSVANVLSFNMVGAHPSDVGHILNQQGIAVRCGHHCCQPLMNKLGVPGTVRASFSIYNTSEDIKKLIGAVKKAKEFF